MKSQWFYLALEYRALGYSMGEFIVAMALCCIAITPEASKDIAAAYRCQIGREQ